jgi:aspartate racemase
MNENKEKIGIVSGIGPLAGSDVLNRVFKNAALTYGTKEDEEYPDVILLSHGIPGVDNKGRLIDLFERDIISMVEQIELQGATVIGIACNTAHVYLPKIHVKEGTVLINLIDVVSRVAAQNLNEKYLLLSSSASREQKIYHSYLDEHHVNYEEVSDTVQFMLDEAIGMVMAYKLEQAGAILDNVFLFAKEAGFNAVIAGCTELPIAIAHATNTNGIRIIDSNEELSKSLLFTYFEKSSKFIH